MTTKYRSNNRLTMWWNSKSPQFRVIASVGSGLATLAVLFGFLIVVRSFLAITPNDYDQNRTTVELPAMGVQLESELPSVFPTPELPPLNLPSPTAIATPAPLHPLSPGFSDDSQNIVDSGSGQASADSGETFQPRLTREQALALAEQILPNCQTAEPVIESNQIWTMRVSADWQDGEFQKLMPCIDAAINTLQGHGINLLISFRAPEGVAAYLQLDAEQIIILNRNRPENRLSQIKFLIKLHLGYSLR